MAHQYVFQIEDTCHTPIKYIQEAFDLIEMDLNTAQPLQNMFPLTELVESFCNGYVTYKGSLSTPPCAEAVTWIVSPYTIGLSKVQLQTFRKLYDSSKNLENNFRPVQPLNGRTVHFVNWIGDSGWNEKGNIVNFIYVVIVFLYYLFIIFSNKVYLRNFILKFIYFLSVEGSYSVLAADGLSLKKVLYIYLVFYFYL